MRFAGLIPAALALFIGGQACAHAWMSMSTAKTFSAQSSGRI
jgi:hypothetical protein